MLELIAWFIIARRIGKVAADNNRPVTRYQLLGIGMWIAGEIVFGIIGVVLILAVGAPNIVVYPFALIGGFVGVSVAFYLAKRPAPGYIPPPRPPSFS